VRTLGSAASVAEVVREEAAREIERIRREADEEITRLEAEARNADVTPSERDARLAAARREVSARQAGEDSADRRVALEEREAWTERAVRLGRERLAGDRDAPSRHQLLLALGVEAALRLPGDDVEIAVAPADLPLLDAAFLEELARRSRKRVSKRTTDGDLPESGCVVSCAGGKVRSDNSLEARTRRFETAWRAALMEIYGP
jgi:vacuolar-type H+-ATPase subunit E/Vma4